MRKDNSYPIWIETGYQLFAEEGHEGIQIERLSRISGLNKSGFYHYFGDTDGFFKHLIREHDQNVDAFLDEFIKEGTYDPGFLNLMIKRKYVTFFQVQLVRNRHIKIFLEAHDRNNQKIDSIILPYFSKEVGLVEEVSKPYYEIMRDVFFTRVNLKNMNYEFLHDLMEEFKSMIPQIQAGRSDSN